MSFSPLIDLTRRADEEALEDIEALMTGGQYEDDYKRETLGIQSHSNEQNAFNHLELARLLQPDNLYTEEIPVPFVMITVDPSAGGVRSRYSAIAAVHPDDRRCAVGLLEGVTSGGVEDLPSVGDEILLGHAGEDLVEALDGPAHLLEEGRLQIFHVGVPEDRPDGEGAFHVLVGVPEGETLGFQVLDDGARAGVEVPDVVPPELGVEVELVGGERDRVVYERFNDFHFFFFSTGCGRGAFDNPRWGGEFMVFLLIFSFPDYWATDKILVDLIRTVRRLPGLTMAKIVVCIESNLAYEAQRQSAMLQKAAAEAQIPQVIIMHEDESHGRVNAGFRTTEDSKKAMALLADEKLCQRRIQFHKNFVYVSTDPQDKLDADSYKKELVKQLEDYKRIIIPSKNPYIPSKELYSGKRGCGTDDDAIAFQLNLMLWDKFHRDRKYSPHWIF